MPTCKMCGDDVDELVIVKVEGVKRRLCEECAEETSQNEAIAEESEAAVQQMMGFQGRR